MSGMTKFTDIVDHYDKKVFGTITKYWAKIVKLLRAKEFLAEFLGTFVLVVSSVM
jgi:hypothetical protein